MRLHAPFVCSLLALPLFLQSQQALYLDINQTSGCIRRIEYLQMTTGQTSTVYLLSDQMGSIQALTAGAPETLQYALAVSLISCEQAARMDLVKLVNMQSRPVFLVESTSSGTLISQVTGASALVRSGPAYYFSSPKYSFSFDTTQLRYGQPAYSASTAAPFVYAGLARHSCLPAYAFQRISGGDTLYIELNTTLGLMLERRFMAGYYRSGTSALYRIDGVPAASYLVNMCRNISRPVTYSLASEERPAYYQDIAPATYSTDYKPAVHTVRAGETLSGIARRYNVSVATLKQLNYLDNPDHIRPGQQLYLQQYDPTLLQEEKSYIYSEPLTARTNTTVKLDFYDPGGPISGGASLTATATSECPDQSTQDYHVVQAGETLYDIARRYYLSVQQLMEWNGLQDPGQIQRCQRINLGPTMIDYSYAQKNPMLPLSQVSQRESDYYPIAPQETYPSARSLVPEYTGDFTVHYVRRGETLSYLAGRYNVPLEFLAQVNMLRVDSALNPGQQLRIPNMRIR